MSFSNEKLKLKELVLWDENARFSDKYFSRNEQELITHMCSKKDFKIELLAKEIVTDWDIPQLEKIVVLREDSNNIVLEGNRRLTVLKLLNKPELSPNEVLKSKFQKLAKIVDISDDFEIECIVVSSKTDGYRIIERKHLKANNEVGWGDQERTNYNVRRGTATEKEEFRVAIVNLMKELDLPENITETVLGPGYVTNFWRIVDNSVTTKKFGLRLDDDKKLIFDKEFPDALKVVIWNVVNKEDLQGNKIDSRSMNTNKEKEAYLSSITLESAKEVDSHISSQSGSDLFGQQTINTVTSASTNKLSSLPKSTSRSYLIPKTFILQISQVKINNIYRELKEDLLLDETKKAVPNAVGVLFRVFLEISLDYYAKVHGKHFTQNDKIGSKIAWVVAELKKLGYKDSEFNNVNKVGSAKGHQSYLSIDNFHEYVHSGTTQPSSNELKAKWDNLESFFKILWNEINNKTKT
jgi:hypothetical protein